MLPANLRKEIEKIAAVDNIPAENLMAVTHVESAGVTFWLVQGKQVPAARPERHYFYRLLKGAERDRAVREGLAHPSMGTLANGREAVYAVIDRMRAINDTAAIESCSWGLGQVMGENWRRLGYSSAQALLEENMSGSAGQIRCMMKFIRADARCLQAIRTGDFTTFARIYNGPGYAANNYDNNMRAWAARYRPLVGKAETEVTPQAQTVQKQVDDQYTKRVKALGASSIKDFQEKNGLVADGFWGPFTEREVLRQEAAKAKRNGEIKAGAGGASGVLFSNVGAELISYVSQLSGLPVAGVQTVVNIVIVLAVGLMVWGLVQRLRAKEPV